MQPTCSLKLAPQTMALLLTARPPVDILIMTLLLYYRDFHDHMLDRYQVDEQTLHSPSDEKTPYSRMMKSKKVWKKSIPEHVAECGLIATHLPTIFYHIEQVEAPKTDHLMLTTSCVHHFQKKKERPCSGN